MSLRPSLISVSEELAVAEEASGQADLSQPRMSVFTPGSVADPGPANFSITRRESTYAPI